MVRWLDNFVVLKKKKKEKEKPSCSFVDRPNVWGSCTCETESYFSLHSSPSPFSTTHFLSLSLSLQLFHHQLSLSLSQRHKNQKRKGGMDLPNWFQALPFILLKFLNWYFHFVNLAWPYILLLLLDPLFSHFFNIEVAFSLSLSLSLCNFLSILLICKAFC